MTEWFSKKQEQGWCELYPHLQECMTAGRRYARMASTYETLADNLAVSLIPGTAEDLRVLARGMRTAAKNCDEVVDWIYVVKDYVLGGDFGREGWSYESWCLQGGYPLKSVSQIQKEARSQGLSGLGNAGLGVLPAVALIPMVTKLAAAAIATWGIVEILDAIREFVQDSRNHEIRLKDLQLCASGDSRACKRESGRASADADAIRSRGEQKTTAQSIEAMFKWTAFGVLAIVGYKVFQKSKYAQKPALNDLPGPGSP